MKCVKATFLAVGWVSGGYTFRPDLTETGQHTRPVDWRASDIPRSNFDQDLLFSMGAAQTVSQPRAGDGLVTPKTAHSTATWMSKSKTGLSGKFNGSSQGTSWSIL